MNEEWDLVQSLLTSAAIGLLVGLERSRHPLAKAGVRTFALIAVLGTLAPVLADHGASPWLVPGALALVGLAVGAASLVDPATRVDDSGTTTVIAALLVFCLGTLIALGHRQLAVGIGVALTAVLHFKEELESFSHRLTAAELKSMLQFGALAAIVLPLLPQAPLDPWGAVSPFNVGLMAVLICGVSLAGYVAWRLTRRPGTPKRLDRVRLLAHGVLGGLVSSTATTLAQARHVRALAPSLPVPALDAALNSALIVILLANATMLVRVALLTAIVAPGLLTEIVPAPAAALLMSTVSVLLGWRAAQPVEDEATDAYRNPAQLGTAVVFALIYAAILVAAAWLQQQVGDTGLYAVALVSGLADLDAVTLSSLRLAATGTVSAPIAATAIACAIGANLLFKAAACATVGGGALGKRVAISFGAQIAVLVLIAGLARVV